MEKTFSLFLIALSIAGSASGQISQDTTTLDLSIRAIRSSDVIAEGFTLIAELKNNSKKAYRLDSVSIYLPDNLDYFYSVAPIKSQELKPQSSLGWKMQFKPTVHGRSIFTWRKVTFLPGQYEISVMVNYSTGIYHAGSPRDPDVLSQSHKVFLKPPLSSLLAGGVAGSFLLTLFIVVFKVKDRKIDRVWLKEIWKSGWSYLIHVFSLFLFGAVVSIMVILVIQRTSAFQLPISLKVEDYLGGMIIGMLSIKLGNALHKLFIKEEKED